MPPVPAGVLLASYRVQENERKEQTGAMNYFLNQE